MGLAAEDLTRVAGIEWLARRGMSVVEAVICNLRHVQHHAAQLNLILRQEVGYGTEWVHRGSWAGAAAPPSAYTLPQVTC